VSRSCTVCSHPESFEINERLVGIGGKLSLRNIAKQYGLNYQAINRHREHIPELLAQASRAEEVAQADGLLDRVEDLQRRTLAILEAAEETSDYRTALAAIRESRSNLELIGEVTKELNRTPTLNFHLNPEWIELRTAILVALEPHPEAAASVSRAMLEIEENGNRG
jgi:hypothetical protein